MRARLGQHFLRDLEVLRTLESVADELPGKTVVEIGCGPGILTERLHGDRIVAIEKDARLLTEAQSKLGYRTEIEFVEGDIQELLLGDITQEPSSLKVVGNLPYYLSHEILGIVLTEKRYVASVMFLLQKEVVRRMASGIGGKEGSRLSIQWARWFDTEEAGTVPPSCFTPAPRVHSARSQRCGRTVRNLCHLCQSLSARPRPAG